MDHCNTNILIKLEIVYYIISFKRHLVAQYSEIHNLK